MEDLAEVTIEEIVRRFPESLSVLQKHRIDLCCGGRLPLREAARKHHMDLEQLLRELREAVEIPR
jgi:regulator of cell morphogenesis and NO signaling